MKVAVVGTGYVGLVVGTCLADTGNDVICVDVDLDKIKRLESGDPVIYEEGLEFLLKRNIKMNRIQFTSDIKTAIETSNIIFSAVGTPPAADGSADLRFVKEVASSIGQFMNDYKIIVNKSTVPVGTSGKVQSIIQQELDKRESKLTFDVVSNPEFLKEGTAVQDFQKPDRIILGTTSEKAAESMKDLFRPFCRTNDRFYVMDNKSAEITKYAANCFLATKISFINQIGQLCEAVGADITPIRKALGADPRIGNKFLFPGIGYGGSCFPKDVKALIQTGKDEGTPMTILEKVDEANEMQKGHLFSIMEQYYINKNDSINGKHFAVWGLSFKPGTDDMREAPSITMINKLLDAGATITAFDPISLDNAKGIFGDRISYNESQYTVLKNADGLVIHTEWNEFRNPDFNMIKDQLKHAVIFDGRNLYSRKVMRKFGFEYTCIGRS